MALQLSKTWSKRDAPQATDQESESESVSDEESLVQSRPQKSRTSSKALSRTGKRPGRNEDKATIQSLTSMVLQARPPEDPHSPARVAKEFTKLRHLIREVTSSCLSSTSEDQDDTDSVVARVIALWLHENVVVGPGPLFKPRFGLPEQLEAPLRSLEEEFASSERVDQDALRNWTLQTFRVMRGHRENLFLADELPKMLKHLSRAIKTELVAPYFWKPDADQGSLIAVLEQAARLAIVLRSCRVKYQWDQRAPRRGVHASDCEEVEPYDSDLSDPILEFAPVYKLENEVRSLVTKGYIVVPDNDDA